MKVLTDKLRYKITVDRNGIEYKSKLNWKDFYDSESELILDLLRCVANERILYSYQMPRGYEYINSFKKFYCQYKYLTNKQMWVLQNRIFSELLYHLYVKENINNKEGTVTDGFGLWKPLSIVNTKEIEDAFPYYLCKSFFVYSLSCSDIYVIELYTDEGKKSFEYKSSLQEFVGYVPEKIKIILRNYLNLVIKHAVDVVGEVDCIIVAKKDYITESSGKEELCICKSFPKDPHIANAICLRIQVD